jgi:hypothetical protein
VHVVLLERQVVARLHERVARLVQPVRVVSGGHGARLGGGQVAEYRSALERFAAAVRAFGHLVHLVQGDGEAAVLAPEAAGARQRAHAESLHSLVDPDSADHNEFTNGFECRTGRSLANCGLAKGTRARRRTRSAMKRDLHETLLRNSVASVGADREGCSGCRRIPLSGELMHDLEDGRHLCSLCLKRVPESQREALRSERVHVLARRLPVRRRAAPRAAAA